MELKKSDAYSKMQRQFKIVGAKPQAYTSLEFKHVRKFENALSEIDDKITTIITNIREGINIDTLLMELQTLMDAFYKKYVKAAKYKNHIDVWNEWQKIEDRFNKELGIELQYAAPTVESGPISPAGNKSDAYKKFQNKFINSVGLKPYKYTSLEFKYVKKFEDAIGSIDTKLKDLAEASKKGGNTEKFHKEAKDLMDNFYTKYIKAPKFKNHIDAWNEFMKLEDKFNEMGINLDYAAPDIKS